MTPATSFPESVPFLLVRPSSHDVSDVLEEEEEATKSVPPRPPPSAVTTTEHSLPSVIVDLRELEASAEEEEARSGDVDVLLLEAIQAHASLRDSRRVQTLHAIEEPRSGGGFRTVGIALLTAFVIAGTAFAGLRVYHVSPGTLGAALHLAR